MELLICPVKAIYFLSFHTRMGFPSSTYTREMTTDLKGRSIQWNHLYETEFTFGGLSNAVSSTGQ
jgi:hypothetical protein